MAYVAPIEDEEQKKEGELGAGGVVTTAAPSSLQSTGSTTGEAAPVSKGGSGFTNLNKYVSANVGQGARMASDVTKDVGQTAQGVREAGTSLQQQALRDIEQGTVKDTGVAASLVSDPTKVNREQFQRQYGATYSGPQDVSGYDYYKQGTQGVGRLEQQLKASQSQEGRKSLLEQAYERPQYTAGQRSLDSFILGASEAGKQQLQNLQQQYSGVGQEFADISKGLESQIGQARQTTQQTREATRQAYDQAVQAQQAELEADRAALQKMQSGRDKSFERMVSDLTGDKVSDLALRSAGIDRATFDFMRSLGYDPTNLITRGEQLKLGDFVEAEQRAKLEALNALNDGTFQTQFESSGALSGPAYRLNRQAVGQGQELQNLQRVIEGRLASESARRRDEAAKAAKLFQDLRPNQIALDKREQFRALTGLTEADYNLLAESGADLSGIVQGGRQLTTGDVFTDADRQQYQQILNALNVGPNLDVTDPGEEGAAFSINRQALQNAIEKGRGIVTERERKKEQERITKERMARAREMAARAEANRM